MIPGVGQAGREQARCEDRPSCEGWKQPRWSSPRSFLAYHFSCFMKKTVTFQERKNNDHLPLFKMGWNSSVWNFLWYCFWQYNWFCNHTIVEQTYDTALREWIFGNIWELLPKRYKKCTGMNENWCELVIGSSPDSCLQPEPRKQIWHFSPGFGPLGLLSKLS